MKPLDTSLAPVVDGREGLVPRFVYERVTREEAKFSEPRPFEPVNRLLCWDRWMKALSQARPALRNRVTGELFYLKP